MADETQFELRLRTILEAYSLPGRRIAYGAQTPLVFLKDDAGKVLLAANNVVPVNGTANYAKGCIFIKTDAPSMERGLYTNVGTTVSCVFQALSSGQKILLFSAPPASGVACHAAVAESAANAFPGPFTQPTIPRTLDCVFAAGWEGGDVTVTGLNQFGEAITQAYVAVAGTTVQGTKAFSSILTASKAIQAGAADTVTLQTGGKLGLPVRILDTVGVLFVNDPADFSPPADCPEAITLDAVNHTFTPESAPDGAVTYKLLCNA